MRRAKSTLTRKQDQEPREDSQMAAPLDPVIAQIIPLPPLRDPTAR